MNCSPPLAASQGASADPTLGESVTQQLARMTAELQQTRAWFNAQIDAQLSSLQQLRERAPTDWPAVGTPAATLYAEPHPVTAAETGHDIARDERPSSSEQKESDSATAGLAHRAIVMPPTRISALDPQMEQDTLRELNDALARAFAEISARGGMLI